MSGAGRLKNRATNLSPAFAAPHYPLMPRSPSLTHIQPSLACIIVTAEILTIDTTCDLYKWGYCHRASFLTDGLTEISGRTVAESTTRPASIMVYRYPIRSAMTPLSRRPMIAPKFWLRAVAQPGHGLPRRPDLIRPAGKPKRFVKAG